MKSYTDIDQSKKLAEILPIESADMCYIQDLLAGCKYGEYKPYIGDLIPAYGQGKIRCWSLAALLKIIANAAAHIDEDGYLDATVCKDVHCVSLINCNGELYKADNLVDACYEMIIKLNEQKLL